MDDRVRFFELAEASDTTVEVLEVAWLIVVSQHEDFVLEKAAATARQLSKTTGKSTFVVIDGLKTQPPESLRPVKLDQVEALYDKFHVAVFAPSDRAPSVSAEMAGVLLSLDTLKICKINESLETAPYNRPFKRRRRALFAFPGIFVPPKVGSQRRALAVLLDLMAREYELDLVIFGGSAKDRRRFEHRMRLVTRQVHWIDVVPDKAVLRNIRRFAYERLAKRYEAQEKFPITLPERIKKYDSTKSRRKVTAILAATRYDFIFAMYCWLIPLFANRQPNTKLACDTQDVMFHREGSFANRLSKVLFPVSRTRKIERELLRRCDVIYAISERDQNIFTEHLPGEDVVLLQSSYNAAPRILRQRAGDQALRFGFIGSAMDANVRALEIVFAEWWTQIKKYSPESVLSICGAVSDAPRVRDLAFLDDEVRLLGFVKDVAEFYRSIDVLLSPVAVSGGLNIKNVEAILQGIPVITNERGAAALAPLRVPFVAETGEEMLDAVARIEKGGPEFEAEQATLFREATEMWGSSRDGDPFERLLTATG